MKFGLEEELMYVNYENINNSNFDGMSLSFTFAKVGQYSVLLNFSKDVVQSTS